MGPSGALDEDLLLDLDGGVGNSSAGAAACAGCSSKSWVAATGFRSSVDARSFTSALRCSAVCILKVLQLVGD